MGFLKFLVWTGCAVGLGIFLAKGEIDGRTPWSTWSAPGASNVRRPRVDRLKDGLEDALEDAKDAVSRKTDAPASASPRRSVRR